MVAAAPRISLQRISTYVFIKRFNVSKYTEVGTRTSTAAVSLGCACQAFAVGTAVYEGLE